MSNYSAPYIFVLVERTTPAYNSNPTGTLPASTLITPFFRGLSSWIGSVAPDLQVEQTQRNGSAF